MHCLVVTCVFPPEPVISAQTSASLARKLAANGDEITVITAFPNRPSGHLYPGYKRHLFQRESSAEGYKLLRCFATFSPTSSLISRFLENISFGLSAGVALVFLPKPDVIYANTWPVFATGILMLVARLRRIPVVLSIQDMYPESLVAQGRFEKDSSWVKLLKKIDTRIAHQAQTVIVISERLAEIYRISRRVSSERIIIIPNWVDETIFARQDREPNIRKKHSIDSQDFLLVYGGNIGVGAGLETAIRAMSFVSAERQVWLLIAGAGSQLSACQSLAKQVGPNKILFHTPWLAEETSAILKAAEILILPTLGQQSAVSVPSKLITYMFSGRPILALALPESETAHMVQESGSGWVIDPDQPGLLARKIEEISKISESRLAQMGKSGREYALQNFVSDVCLSKVVDAILSAAKP